MIGNEAGEDSVTLNTEVVKELMRGDEEMFPDTYPTRLDMHTDEDMYEGVRARVMRRDDNMSRSATTIGQEKLVTAMYA